MTNLGLEQALANMDIPFVRAKVGDRYVLEQLAEHGWNLGGEGSGHIVCRNILPTGDATIAAVQVLKAVAQSGQTIHQLKHGMQKLPQKMINVRLAKKVDIAASPAVAEHVAAAESRLANRGRVLLRPSGTEPVVRVMVEGSDLHEVEQVCEILAEQVEKELQALVS